MRKTLRHEFFKRQAKSMVEKRDSDIRLSLPSKPMEKWRVAFLTTAGVHLKTDDVFQVEKGDYSLRYIPKTATHEDLMISHTHYDTRDAEKDISCVFPLEHLHELEKERIIGSVSRTHIGMMGYIPNTEALLKQAMPQVIETLQNDHVDVLLLSPG